jgi:hypothetical protein
MTTNEFFIARAENGYLVCRWLGKIIDPPSIVVCQTFDKGTADEIVFAANNGDFIHPT